MLGPLVQTGVLLICAAAGLWRCGL